MTRQDPGAATGTQAYPPEQRCECGELWEVHAPGDPRGACSYSECNCRRFVERPADLLADEAGTGKTEGAA